MTRSNLRKTLRRMYVDLAEVHGFDALPLHDEHARQHQAHHEQDRQYGEVSSHEHKTGDSIDS